MLAFSFFFFLSILPHSFCDSHSLFRFHGKRVSCLSWTIVKPYMEWINHLLHSWTIRNMARERVGCVYWFIIFVLVWHDVLSILWAEFLDCTHFLQWGNLQNKFLSNAHTQFIILTLGGALPSVMGVKPISLTLTT